MHVKLHAHKYVVDVHTHALHAFTSVDVHTHALQASTEQILYASPEENLQINVPWLAMQLHMHGSTLYLYVAQLYDLYALSAGLPLSYF